MSDQHTPEPWGTETTREGSILIVGSPGLVLAEIECVNDDGSIDAEDAANARRIVACVNACKGIPTEFLEQIGAGPGEIYASIRHALTLLPDRPDEARGWLEECLR